jgi:hypothetical protein
MFRHKKKHHVRRPSPMLSTKHSEELLHNPTYTYSILRSR